MSSVLAEKKGGKKEFAIAGGLELPISGAENQRLNH